MKIMITADWHLRSTSPICRTDNFMEKQFAKLEAVHELEVGTEFTIHAGDLFHVPKPSIGFLNQVKNMLPDPMYIIPGNHDLPYSSMDYVHESALSLLSHNYWLCTGDFEVLCSETDETDKCVLHFFPYGSNFDTPQPNDFPTWKEYHSAGGPREGIPKIAVIHYLTFPPDKPPYPNCNSMNSRTLMEKLHGFDFIITGDNHTSFVDEYNGTILINPGSLMRQTSDQIKHEPCVFHIDTETKTYEQFFINDIIDEQYVLKKEDIIKVAEPKISNREELEEFITSLKGKTTMVELNFLEQLRAIAKNPNTGEEIKLVIEEVLNNADES